MVARIGDLERSPLDSFCLVSVKPDAILTGLRVAAVCLCLLKGQTPVDGPIRLVKMWGEGAEDFVCHGRVVVNFVNCSRSEAVLTPQCCPFYGSLNNSISDPYQLAGLKVGSDVENHGRWW